MRMLKSVVAFSCAMAIAKATNFTIIGGQIFTPGLAIVDAPQPNTPLGGQTLHVALDVSGDGKLELPPYSRNTPTRFNNITIFLTSYVTGLNLTVTNGTASSGNASLGDIMLQEPGSTVKHVNWLWPACLVGNGQPASPTSARGLYNISIHQNFLYNSTAYFTVFTLPIQVTNSIPADSARPACEVLTNPLVLWDVITASGNTIPPSEYPWTDGRGTETAVPTPTMGIGGGSEGGTAIGAETGQATSSNTGTGLGTGSETSSSTRTSSPSQSSSAMPDIGGQKPEANPGDGLGGAACLTPFPAIFISVVLLVIGLLLVR